MPIGLPLPTSNATELKSDGHVSFSVIVPVAPGEMAWPRLLADLAEQLPSGVEILVAGTDAAPQAFAETAGCVRRNTAWLTTRAGRAAQMNDAARSSSGDWLWFLHADSRLTPGVVASLQSAIRRRARTLFYFRLRFYDGPGWLRWNELGVAVRCRLWRLPFGDQGFCLPRELFFRLGGFSETAPYGEDHLLVWQARRANVPICGLPAVLETSGRKYAEQGWAYTTLRHLWLTARQAVPECARAFRWKER